MAEEKLAPNVFAFPEVAAPGTPPVGYVYFYFKSDGHAYIKDDTGTETDLTDASGGAMTSFNAAGDSGTPQTITDGNTLTLAGGAGIDTSAAATDTVNIAVDNTVIRTTGTQSIGTGLTIDTPTIANFTNAAHNHTNAAGGGQITDAALSAAVGIAKGGTNANTAAGALANLSGAHNTLNNLGTVAINTTLLSDTDNTDDLGSSSTKWRAVYTNALYLEERAAPSTPSSGDLAAYADTTGVAKAINDAGVTHTLSNVYALIRDERSSGTNGGTTSNATWNPRPLNTEVADPFGIVAISSDKAVLVAGKYVIDVRACAGAASGTLHRLRAYNVTGTATIAEGTNSVSDGGQRKFAHLRFEFTSNGSDEWRIDHYTVTGVATTGLGTPITLGSNEVYMEIEIWKVD